MRWCALLWMIGCGGDTVEPPVVPEPTHTGDTGPPPTDVTHDEHIQPIWNRACGPCHLVGSFTGGLNLDDGFVALVGRPSEDVPAMRLVDPFQLDKSYLWHKLNGTQTEVNGAGATMPKNGSLTREELELIEVWIREGAVEGEPPDTGA